MVITKEDLLLQRVYRWEREFANGKFLTQPSGGQVREWTWGQAMNESRRMAAYLKAQRWERGSAVAILSKNSAWWIMADLAIWMAGYVSVPVYPSLRELTVRQILEHSRAKACFFGEVERETAPACGSPGVAWIALPNASSDIEVGWESLIEANTPIHGAPERSADEIATIIYTSGTTGNPKGVMHRFHGFAQNAKALADLLGFSGRQRVLSYLPLAHIMERVGGEALSLRLATHMYFTEGIDTFLEDVARARPTIFLSVPRLLTKIQQGVFAKVSKSKLERLMRIPAVNVYLRHRILRQLGFGRVGMAACGGAPLPPEIFLWYRRLGLPLLEGYGMTETMITHLPPLGAVRSGCVGPALDGVETKVSDAGELLIRSEMNMTGYYREPELTRQAFTEDGFFRTGDLVVIEPDGQMRIVGRIKEQFKTSKGKYVVPAPIESKLMEHPAVEACCLMGSGQPSPFAMIILADAVRKRCVDPEVRRDLERSLLALLEGVNAELDPFERVSMIVVADGPWTIGNGLITPTLKIRRSVVEDQYRRLFDQWTDQQSGVVWESTPSIGAASYMAGAGSSTRDSASPDQAK